MRPPPQRNFVGEPSEQPRPTFGAPKGPSPAAPHHSHTPLNTTSQMQQVLQRPPSAQAIPLQTVNKQRESGPHIGYGYQGPNTVLAPRPRETAPILVRTFD
jgi:hypothetical protein